MAALLLALACKLPASSPSEHPSHGNDTTEVDADQDGYNASVDCNDADASIHPGMKETCGNGVDDNCNGVEDGCLWSGEGALEGWQISGTDVDERFGSTLAVCDANGDGQQDLVIGSAGTNGDAGAVTLFYGPLGADDPDPPWKILGSAPSRTFGSALDCHSDLTGDGADDLLIGEPDETGNTAGTMYLLVGGDSGMTMIADAYTMWWGGEYSGDRFGYSVFAFDADGDGHEEIAVTSLGVPGWPTQYGRTYIIGPTPELNVGDYVFGTAAQRLLGTAGNAGDMNGDGIDELAVTADLQGYPWDVALLYQQPLDGLLSTDDADVQLAGSTRFVARYTQLGHADLDGDGYDDFLIANPDDHDDAGAVSVFFGRVTGDVPGGNADLELIGRSDSLTGNAVASPGDLDGDGKDELLIGAPRAGGVYLYRGGGSGRAELDDDAQASWWSDEQMSAAGAALGVGNLTGVIDEFAVGVPQAGDDDLGAVVLVPSLEL